MMSVVCFSKIMGKAEVTTGRASPWTDIPSTMLIESVATNLVLTVTVLHTDMLTT